MDAERLVLWGTADLGKPRTRILVKGLQGRGVVVGEYLFDVWRGVDDKSQLKGLAQYARVAANYLLAYPVLIWRYLRAPRHDAVFVAYMGHFDVLVLRPFARMRRAKIIWDAFLSLYDTVIEDRALAKKGGFAARFVSVVEKCACAAADVIVLDTDAHVEFFKKRYNIPSEKLFSVWVGAETDVFLHRPLKKSAAGSATFHVLFYGQFIPLHGLEFIIDAVRRTKDPSIRWTLIGRGQESEKINNIIARQDLPSLSLIDWVDYHDLPEHIASADLCLGVFGTSDKAARVIPNKVFQVLAVGRPLVTSDSRAIREILEPDMPGVWLIEPGAGVAIAEAVAAAKRWREEAALAVESLYVELRAQISPEAAGKALIAGLARAP